MFTLALLIGIYSYLIFLLGLLGLLYKLYIVLLTVAYFAILTYLNREILIRTTLQYFNVLKKTSQLIKRRPFIKFLMIIISLQAVVNFTGVLGPELGFDALWYHLTLPKMYLENHSIFYIPGGLFYYSSMPKLTEMLYISALAFGNETIAKLIHFSFGILTLIVLFKISRKFLSKIFSLLAVILFYSNPIVGWISTTAYIDLARTFFEVMALWAFLEWQEKKKQKLLVASAILLGLAISTKLLAIGSLLIFSALIVYVSFTLRKKISFAARNIVIYWCFALFISLPWFIFSFVHTKNPVYPFFTNIYPVVFNFNLINSLNLSDSISLLYIIMLPVALLYYKKFTSAIKRILLFSFLAVIVWYLTPQTGGGRFILPYVPAFSIVSVVVIDKIRKLKIKKLFIASIILFSVFLITYRVLANSKYISVILGKDTKTQFLSNHLNFSFGDFYDTDGYFAKKIKPKDTVLLYGFHNLYYVNFPSIDSSYVKKGDMFNFIAVHGNNLPKRFKFWNLIYYNEKTNVKLYSIGGLKWIY